MISGPRVEALSAREIEIARYYAGGKTDQQIAGRLNIAPSTVRTHLATIYRKLAVSSKLALRDAIGPGGMATEELAKELWPRPEKPSIAVLAFENMSGDPEQEYFSDECAKEAVARCMDVLPNTTLEDLKRVAIRGTRQMGAFRTRLVQAGVV